jgi:hypothetical protein
MIIEYSVNNSLDSPKFILISNAAKAKKGTANGLFQKII